METAARAVRRSGYNGSGVAEIMKEAGLTHGGFYAHFASREGMLAEAADRAGAEAVAVLARVAAAAPPKEALEALRRGARGGPEPPHSHLTAGRGTGVAPPSVAVA
ncbi:MAG TPA: TetR/AcrR family transcriptional regulator [Gemmatimonadales bacterium]|nr:TetR/AcrR family transcriptional regulator [Gemmatimonadales bacterium]